MEEMTMNEAFHYDDIHLIPDCSTLSSRSLADTSVTLGKHTFKLPVVPANMSCTIDQKLAKWLTYNGYFYIMHRFGIPYDEFIAEANSEDWPIVSASIGVMDVERIQFEILAKAGHRVDYLTIDVAHAHSYSVRRVIRMIKEEFPETFLIVGNVATSKAVRDLESWGADAIKVGIGGGSPCSTKYKTGFTVPMFSCVESCSHVATVPLIADGGIKYNGDIAKALVAGASLVMAGNIFTACKDSPAETISTPLAPYDKLYYGSASARNKRHAKHLEGVEITLPGNGITYEQKYIELQEDISSAISYAGGKDLSAFLSTGYNICRA
jgi:GMP reductase